MKTNNPTLIMKHLKAKLKRRENLVGFEVAEKLRRKAGIIELDEVLSRRKLLFYRSLLDKEIRRLDLDFGSNPKYVQRMKQQNKTEAQPLP